MIIIIFGNNAIGKSYNLQKLCDSYNDVYYQQPYTFLQEDVALLGKYDKRKYPGTDSLGVNKFTIIEDAISTFDGRLLIFDCSVISYPKLLKYKELNSEVLFYYTTLDIKSIINNIERRGNEVTDKKILNIITKYKYIEKCYKQLLKSEANIKKIHINELYSILQDEIYKGKSIPPRS